MTTPLTYEQWLLLQVDDTDDGDQNELLIGLQEIATDTAIDYVKDELAGALFEDYGEFVLVLVDQVEFLIDAAIDFFTTDVVEVLSGGGDAYTYQGYFIGNKHFTIFGRGGNDYLVGGPNDDFIHGGSGADRMYGMGGSDTYFVENAGDEVWESYYENYTWKDYGGNDTVISEVNYTLPRYVENLVFLDTYDTTTQTLKKLMGWGNESKNRISGNSADNYLNGMAGDDTLIGGLGNDTLDGGTGSDDLIGGPGDDVYYVDDTFDWVSESSAGGGHDLVIASVNWRLGYDVEDLTLTGNAIEGVGNWLANKITGNDKNNTLVSRGGNDTLVGGKGDDVYVVEYGGTVTIDEKANEGTDTVQTDQSYTLADNVENLTLLGAANINGTGNWMSNAIVGNAGNNVLDGGGGTDTLSGGEGDDTYNVYNQYAQVVEGANAGVDLVKSTTSFTLSNNVEDLVLLGTVNTTGGGNDLNNRITGNSGNNTLYGFDGNDVLIGGAGSDTLYGGKGDDVYYLDSASDVVIEYAGEGNDVVVITSSISYSLPDNVDHIEAAEGVSVTLTGNDSGNILTGSSGNDTLQGLGGNDSLRGGMGDDRLDGGTGNDTLEGGLGDDTYVVDSAGDVLYEAWPQVQGGIDTVESSISFTLPSLDFENLVLTGASAINGTGTVWGNTITGNNAANVLNGDGGVLSTGGLDYLYGLGGNDTLTGSFALAAGGTGDDVYVMYIRGNGTGIGGIPTLIIDEAPGEGNDTLVIDASLATLTTSILIQTWFGFGESAARQQVENIQLFSIGADPNSVAWTVDVWGNELDNRIEGNAAANKLEGFGGNNQLFGHNGNDTLLGAEGNDTLDGGAGADSMRGWTGGDTYVVDNAADVVDETDGTGVLYGPLKDMGGLDTVLSSVSYTLPVFVEDLTLTGTAAINGVGNAEFNLMIGNDAANRLEGGFGSDTLYGGGGDDTLDGGGSPHRDVMYGGAGNDVYVIDNNYDQALESTDGFVTDSGGIDTVTSWISIDASNYTALPLWIENLTLLGSASVWGSGNKHANVITGNAGRNRLWGGYEPDVPMVDTLRGGAGDDTYVIYAPDVIDVIEEAANEGTDTVETWVSYALGAINVENLSLQGTDAINGTGNTLDNLLRGNSAANLLSGGLGNDTLDGAGGGDTLQGGAGNDTYLINDTSALVVEQAGEGSADQVVATVSYTLGAEVENLVLAANYRRLDGTGNALANRIEGHWGNNRLDGGAGADTLIGGLGDDTYTIDNVGDVVIEGAGEGFDSVLWWAGAGYTSYTLGNNIEGGGILGTYITATLTGNALDNFLSGSDGYLNTLIGGEGNDVIWGNGGQDTLIGGNTYDFKYGVDSYGGTDTLIGGDGNDTYVLESWDDVVIEKAGEFSGFDTVRTWFTYTLGANIESGVITGSFDADLTGNGLVNFLYGNSGANVIDGGGGADFMTGGDGGDTYYVDNSNDVIYEYAQDAGIDRVFASRTFQLRENIEELTLTGWGVIHGTGNDSNNVITGNNNRNLLNGWGGADTMRGQGGDDVYFVDNVGDVCQEDDNNTIVYDFNGDGQYTLDEFISNDDRVISTVSYTLGANIEELVLRGSGAINGTGNGLNNRLIGDSGANVLDGGAGADTMIGGGGDDTYAVDNVGDVIAEAPDGGTDTVRASINYTLVGSIENLTLTGTGNLVGTGSNANNVITGNAGANSLDGKAGNDTLLGGGGNDTLIGGAGDDSMAGGAGDDLYWVTDAGDIVFEAAGEGTDTVNSRLSYTLGANVESLNLFAGDAIDGTGNALNNLLIGNNAANVLDGGAGADTMQGLGGDDTYIVDNAGDVVVEGRNGGTDTVRASVSRTLSANVENLVLNGTAVSGTGNELANTITGNDADNVLDGGAGADVVIGGLGNDTVVFDAIDTLSGGAGTDTLVVQTALADLTALPPGQVTGFERVDLSGAGANALKVDRSTVFAVSDTDTLLVMGTAADAVTATGGWRLAGNVDVDGQTYAEYVSGGATLRVDVDVDRSGIELGNAGAFNLASLDGSNGFKLTGAAAGDGAGFSVAAAGDVNGDGYADLIVGAPNADSVAYADTGAAYLIFGKASGFTSSMALGSLGAADGTRIEGIEASGHAGYAVAGAGDVNGDGFGDLLIGAPDAGGLSSGSYTYNYATYSYDYTPGTPNGKAYVTLGSAGGLVTNDLGSLDGSNGFSIQGSYGLHDGFSVAGAGDIDGDGFDDILVGSKDAAGTYPGYAYALRGYARDNWSYSNVPADYDIVIKGKSNGDGLGLAVAGAGDFNGDGVADLIVGAPNAGYGAGAAYVVFGSAGSGYGGGLSSFISVDGGEGYSSGVVRLAGAPYDQAGRSVSAAGDVNGDGIGDVIVGAPGTGTAYVVFGSNAGFNPSIDLSTLDGSNGFRISGAAADGAGASVAGVGDVNGDGYDDLLIGAPGADANGTDSGAGFLVFGASSWSANFALASIDGANGMSFAGEAAGDALGTSVSGAGDLNSDGFADFVLGAPSADANGTDAGAAYVVFGGDLNGAAGHIGTGGNDTLAGGDGETFYALAGDDRIELSGNAPIRVDGGAGNDTLALDAAGASFTLAGGLRMRSIEAVDLAGTNANTLVVTAEGIIALSEATDTLTVRGTSADAVQASGTWLDAGRVAIGGETYVQYRSGSALLRVDADVNRSGINVKGLSLPDLSGDGGFSVVSANSYDTYSQTYSGWWVNGVSGAGDLNGDGFDDYLASTSYYSPGSGHVPHNFVVFGSATRPTGDVAPSAFNSSNSMEIIGRLDDVRSIGDLNGDGFADLMGTNRWLSLSGETYATSSHEGAAYVIFSDATPAASVDVAALDGTNGFRIIGGAGDWAGAFVATGDVNGDGRDDLMITRNAPEGAWEVDVVYGKAGGFGATVDLSTLALDGTDGFRIVNSTATANTVVSWNPYTVEPRPDFYPVSMSTGDFDSDGYMDILLGEGNFRVNDPGGSLDGRNLGATWIVYGSGAAPAGGTLDIGTAAPQDVLTILGAGTGNRRDRFGETSTFVGDMNGDGFEDIAIGAWDAMPTGGYDSYGTGQVYVVFGGSRSYFNHSFALSGSEYEIINGFGVVPMDQDGAFAFKIDGNVKYGNAGWDLSAAGDVNGDGLADLLVGANNADGGSGLSYLIYGKKAVKWQAPDLNLGTLSAGEGLLMDGVTGYERLGIDLAPAGDLDGDGLADFLVGGQANAEYVLYERNFTGSPNFNMGTAGDDTLSGFAYLGINVTGSLIGGTGNDTLSAGSQDGVYGGAGDDYIRVSCNDFLHVDGGSGEDTLRNVRTTADYGLDTLNFVNAGAFGYVAPSKVRGIDVIDLGTNSNLKVDAASVGNMTDNGTLRVVGSAGIVTLDAGKGGWSTTAGSGETAGYMVATSGGSTVLVQNGLTLVA